MGIAQYDPPSLGRPAWNAGRTVGVKKPLKQKHIWQIRFFLDQGGRLRDRALFDLAIDSKLRGCDLVKMKIGTLVTGKTFAPVQRLFSRRPEDQCSLKLRATSAQACSYGSAAEAELLRTMRSRAAANKRGT